jgi:hypothetical protein
MDLVLKPATDPAASCKNVAATNEKKQVLCHMAPKVALFLKKMRAAGYSAFFHGGRRSCLGQKYGLILPLFPQVRTGIQRPLLHLLVV